MPKTRVGAPNPRTILIHTHCIPFVLALYVIVPTKLEISKSKQSTAHQTGLHLLSNLVVPLWLVVKLHADFGLFHLCFHLCDYTKALLLTRMARSNVLYDILSNKTMSGIELDICYAWSKTSNTQQSNHGQSGLTCPLAPAQVIISSISQATQTCMKDIDIQT